MLYLDLSNNIPIILVYQVHKIDLERAVRQSNVKINFNDTDHLLASLKVKTKQLKKYY